MTAIKKKVAWIGQDEHEGHSAIVFHHHRMAARREAAEQLGQDFEGITITRAQQFDSYAEKGHVPKADLIAAGWWFECSGCYDRVTEDTEGHIVDADDHVYCGAACKKDHEQKVAGRV